MTEAELAALEHEGFIHLLTVLADCAEDGTVMRFGGVVAAMTGSTVPLFNAVLIEDDAATSGDLDAAVAHAKTAGNPSSVYLRAGRDDRFAASVGPGGPSERMPGMLMRPAVDHEGPDGLEIHRVCDAAGYGHHVALVSEVFGVSPGEVRSFTHPSLLDHDGVALYVGYVDGEPVVTSLGVEHDRLVTIFNVATREDHRRRGYGAALTMQPVHEARARGCEAAALQSSPSGFPVYERLGFTTVVDYSVSVLGS